MDDDNRKMNPLPFVCPLMNVLLAAFKKYHIIARHDIKRDDLINRSIITLEIV